MTTEPFTQSCNSLEIAPSIRETVLHDSFQAAIRSHCDNDAASYSDTYDTNAKRPKYDLNFQAVDSGIETNSSFSLLLKQNPNEKQKQFDDMSDAMQNNTCNDRAKDDIKLSNDEAEKVKAWNPVPLSRLPIWATKLTSHQSFENPLL